MSCASKISERALNLTSGSNLPGHAFLGHYEVVRHFSTHTHAMFSLSSNSSSEISFCSRPDSNSWDVNKIYCLRSKAQMRKA
ncbi:hypothetical protein AOLI_G00020860 [Acnodon oligacanthus]